MNFLKVHENKKNELKLTQLFDNKLLQEYNEEEIKAPVDTGSMIDPTLENSHVHLMNNKVLHGMENTDNNEIVKVLHGMF